jgi:hypothetical protein
MKLIKNSFLLLLVIWFFAVFTSRPASLQEPFKYDRYIDKELQQIDVAELHINFYYLLLQNPYNARAHLYLQQYIKAHPENGPDQNGAVSHLLKRNIRAGVPMLAHLFHLKYWQLYVLQFVMAFFFLLLLYKTLLLIAPGRTDLAIWFCFAFACSITLKQFFIDQGHWDAYAWFFMLLSIWLAMKRNIIFVLPFALALLIDERTLFSIPVFALLLWHSASAVERKKQMLRFFGGCAVALALLFAWRYHFMSAAGERDASGITVKYIIYNSKAVASSLFLTYEFLWLLVYAGFFFMLRARMYKQMAIIIAALLPAFIITFMVADLARSIGYLFPFFILMFQQYQQNAGASGIIALKHMAILNAVFPSYYPFLYNSTISDYQPFWGYYEIVIPVLTWMAEFLDKLLL